jgi:hypothetical protein
MDGGLEKKRFAGPGRLDTGFLWYDIVEDVYTCSCCKREGSAKDFTRQPSTSHLYCKPCSEAG